MACQYCGSKKHTTAQHPSEKADLSKKVANKLTQSKAQKNKVK